MGRFRTLSPELLAAADVATLRDGVHRLFHGLYGIVDDDGRCVASPAFLNGTVFWGAPRKIEEVARYRAELEQRKLIRVYEVDGVEYLAIVGWRTKGSKTYQVVNKYQPSRLPAPPPERLPEQDGSPPAPNGRGREEEGNGREEKAADAAVYRLRDFWLAGYKTKHNSDYVLLPADDKLLKQLEGNPGIEETERRMQIAFDAPPVFPPQPWPLRTFVSNINACAKPTTAAANSNKDVRVGRVEPQTDCAAYGDGDQDI